MRYISNPSDLPTGPHLAVLVFSKRYVEGDERSKTAPGHGYPAHYEDEVKYIVFDSQEELARWVGGRGKQESGYRVLHATPKTVETHVSVTLK